ncbi:MAG: membrane lipoprotein lipid attachment site-containing protein [Demequinaceae bacterium]|nr:membrane lipoprotein lipid attachment site-containing protein [Demequinaceae bacterium]
MKKTLLALVAVGALALSACSSDDTPDSTPGEGNPTPQVTDDNTNPGNSSFCEMISDSEVMSQELNDATDALDDIIENQEDWDSPEAIAALHTQGQAMIDYADDVAAVYDQAAAQAGDPTVSEAFSTLAEYMRILFKGMGQAAVESDSIMDYFMNMGTYLDEEQLTAMTDDLSEAGPLISEYIYDTCGYSGFGD